MKSNLKLNLLVVTIGVLCIGLVSCNPPKNASEYYYFQKEGVQFQPRTLIGNAKPAFTYFLRNNDEVEVSWESFNFLFRVEDSPNENCDFSMQRCVEDLCMPNNDLIEGGIFGLFSILSVDLDFMRSDNPTEVMQFGSWNVVSAPLNGRNFENGCRNKELTRPVFQVVNSGLYRFINPIGNSEITPIHTGNTNGEVKIYVLDKEENLSQTVKFDLKKETIESIVYWRWEMPDDPVWSNNFSKNVKVSKVRILENGNEIKPSKIAFLPNFQGAVVSHGQEQSNSCYINNNEIDLNQCDNNADISSQDINLKVTTPIYIQNQPPELLTWLAEFNTIQGGDDATNATDLEIEFTIEAIN